MTDEERLAAGRMDFCFHGERYLLEPSALAAGRDLWRGISAERGECEAKRVLIERLETAGRMFGIPGAGPPTPEQTAKSMPAGPVLISSMAALMFAGIRRHPDPDDPNT